jgi:hypothetical protein
MKERQKLDVMEVEMKETGIRGFSKRFSFEGLYRSVPYMHIEQGRAIY